VIDFNDAFFILTSMEELKLKHYPIPNASKYEIASNAVVHRILKSGKRKPMKTQLVHRSADKDGMVCGQHQITIVCDDKKRRTYSPYSLLREAQILAGEDHPWLEKRHREIGSQYIEIPDLWCLYLVDHGGNVMHQLNDAQGIYFKQMKFYYDESRHTPLEKINLRDVSFRPRTYTRKQLKEMQEERMQELMKMHS